MKRLLLAVGFIVALVGTNAQSSQALTINFDDVTNGVVIDTQYSALGVTLANPLGGNIFARDASGFAPSSPNVVSVFGTGLPYFNATFGAVDATFSTAQLSVSIDARPVGCIECFGPILNRPFLEAYDGATFLGRVLYAGALPTGVAEVGPTETLTFTSPTANITRVRFSSQISQGGQPVFGLFDNLTFSATTLPPSVPEPTSVLLLGAGLAGLGLLRKSTTRNQQK